ncbi:MAG: DeoR/GlpR transcriptional regulator [Marivivens sp.]|nr:DeoR/GlpR transcriptional regulator [Marivivens sp.]
MNTAQRHDQILSLLTSRGRASVEEIAKAIGKTPQTIRRDLTTLATQNKVVRFHGGASLLAGIEYTNYEARQNIAAEQKSRIGAACAAIIPNDVAVMINSGTTTAAVARELAGHTGLRVVTDSVKISYEISSFSGVEVMVPGGRIRPSDGAIVGHQAIEFIAQFRPDFAIIGAAAIARDGSLLDYDMAEVAVARAMIAHARNVILCVDSGKFHKMAPVRIAGLSDINVMVTDTRCSEVLRQMCQAERVRVIEA